jgi:hypothetical protein
MCECNTPIQPYKSFKSIQDIYYLELLLLLERIVE